MTCKYHICFLETCSCRFQPRESSRPSPDFPASVDKGMEAGKFRAHLAKSPLLIPAFGLALKFMPKLRVRVKHELPADLDLKFHIILLCFA